MRLITIACVAVCFGLLHVPNAVAQTWTTSDEVLTVTPPDASQFRALPDPPAPFVALWVSSDDSTRIGVMKADLPANVKLNQASVEEGLSNEIRRPVDRLPSRSIAGHEVWSMRGTGPAAEITQAVIQHDDTLYKLMAVSTSKPPNTKVVNDFMNSLVINKPQTQAPRSATQATQAEGATSEGVNLHEISKTAGGIGALLFIGLLLYFATRKKKPKSTQTVRYTK